MTAMNEKQALLDTLKERLPKGLEFIIGENNPDCFSVEIIFRYQGMDYSLWIHASIVPRFYKMDCDRAIAIAMQHFARQLKDNEMEWHWMQEYQRT